MVKIENVKYEYIREEDSKKVVALNDVSIDINKGEFIVIIGHNGSGKSTLAKNINALLTPNKGKIYVKGKDTTDQDNIWEIRQTAGMVFQNPDNQLVSAIVEDDVAFGPENLGIKPDEIRERVDKALKDVDMIKFKNNPPHLLSGGQKQRIAIAGVIAMKPECIIFDEPTAMLDPNGRAEVMETMLKLNKEEGITVIHITHFMEEAVNADRVIVIDDGEIILQGKPKDVFIQVEKLKELQLEVPMVTELAYQLSKEGIEIPKDILTIDEMVRYICQ